MITGLIALSPFDSPFSPPGHLYLHPPPSLLYLTLWISLCVPGCGEYFRNRLLARLVFPLLSPSSPPGHLYLSPSSSLLYVTPWTSLGVPNSGEHIGNWLLARWLSPLLTPSLLLLVTSVSLIPLLFSMQLCEPLWVSPTVEKLFTINLDVLSSMLYRWRILEATVRIRLKARGRRVKSKTWEHQKTPDSREH